MKSDTNRFRAIMVIGSIALTMIIFAIVGLVYSMHPKVAPTHQVSGTITSETTNQFIELCSGLDASDEAIRLIGTANCLGRIRGFIDGYQTAVVLHEVPAMPMWCVDSDVTDKEVLDTILVWIEESPAEYKEITDKVDGLNAAIAITIRAIHKNFSCGTMT